MTKKSDNQVKNSRIERIQPYMWKKGQSGNLKGRPKGKTMKEYAKELLAAQTEEERQAFLHGLPKEVIWKMAEGNPEQGVEHKGNLSITVEQEVADKFKINANATPDTSIEGQPPIQSS